MISFKIPKKDVSDIILTFSKQNNIPEYFEVQLVAMIESSDYVDYIEAEKLEREKMILEMEFSNLAFKNRNLQSEYDINDMIKKRSYSQDIESVRNFDYSIPNNNNSVISDYKKNDAENENSEFDYEVINKTEIDNEFNKKRCQSVKENSNTIIKLKHEKSFKEANIKSN